MVLHQNFISFSNRSCRRLAVTVAYPRRMSNATTPATTKPMMRKFGGHDEKVFQYMCERGSKYITDVLKPQITLLEKGEMEMLLPYNSSLQGGYVAAPPGSTNSSEGGSSVPCIHEGVVASMLDHVAGFCCWTSIEQRERFVSTADIEVCFLRPAPCEDLHFTASTTMLSAELASVDAVCWNTTKTEIIATGRSHFKPYVNPQSALFEVFSFLHRHLGFTAGFLNSTVTLRKPNESSKGGDRK